MIPTEFRPIQLERDRDTAIAFRADSYACSFGSAERFWSECGPGAERYIEWLRARIERDPLSAVHVWRDGKIIGQLELGTLKQDPRVGYVNLYYLTPEARGSGISAQLDDYAVRYLKGKGHALARLSVSPSNTRAIRFYSRMGWKSLGIRPDAPEVILMERAL